MADPADPLADHVAETVGTVAAVSRRARRDATRHQRAIERTTAALGRPRTLYWILAFVAAWIGLNLALPQPFDPMPYFALQGVLGFAALLSTALILISQNRQTREAEQRAQLDLQVNLVAERKITKLIELLEELRRDLPSVRDRIDPAAESMKAAVDATAVLSALEATMSHQAAEDDEDDQEEGGEAGGDDARGGAATGSAPLAPLG